MYSVSTAVITVTAVTAVTAVPPKFHISALTHNIHAHDVFILAFKNKNLLNLLNIFQVDVRDRAFLYWRFLTHAPTGHLRHILGGDPYRDAAEDERQVRFYRLF